MRFLNMNLGYLNNLTIKKLLFYWALVCSAAIILAALTTIITDKIVNARLNASVEKAVKIEELSRNITETVAKFILRKYSLLQANSSEEFEKDIFRKPLELTFQNQLGSLASLVNDHVGTSSIMIDLQELYQDFLIIDESMANNQMAILLLREDLRNKINKLENHVEEISALVEEVAGVINLESSRARRNMRNSMQSGRMSRDELLVYGQDAMPGEQSRILRATHQVQQSVSTMVEFSHKIILETDRDELISVRGNEIEQQYSLLNTALGWLKTDLENTPELLGKIRKIDISVALLMDLLIRNSDSIYELRLHDLKLTANMNKTVALSNNALDDMMDKLEMLSTFAKSLSEEATRNTEKINRISHVIITIVSLVVVLILLSGIKIIRSRINNPLQKISSAVSNLSHGILTSRLDNTDFSRDEFAVLASDFNNFAEKNQQLIVELSDAKNALQESESRTKAIVENALVGIAHLSHRQFISVNQRFEDMFGYGRDEITGLYTEIIFPGKNEYEAVGKAAYALLENGDTYKSEWQVQRKDGTLFWCAISAKSIVEGMPERGTIWLYEDISQRKESEQELKKLASFDVLTELPNRSLFMDRLMNSVNLSKRSSENLVLLFIDLDRFKQVNDSLGHAVGDQLLQQVAARLQSCVRTSDTVARLGGDEFTVLLMGLKSPDYAANVAENILSSLAKPFVIDGHEINISPSIGISIYPNDAEDISGLLQNADSAMYHAKRVGRNNYQFYNEAMNAKSLDRLNLENRLRRAMHNNDYILYYQPLVASVSRQTIGYEALLRLKNNETILSKPSEFIPILEDNGLIIPVSEWVLSTACGDMARLGQITNSNVRLSVNLSARLFRQNNLIKQVKNILENTKIDPVHLDFEITETVLMTDSEHSQRMLEELHDLGLSITLDDFGTGYSSLAYLKKFPIDTIKIDRSFVRDVLSDPSDAAICEAILAIAHRLKMQVVAEGIETEQQFRFFMERGCPVVQGYLFGKPDSLQNLLADTCEDYANDKHHAKI